VVSFLLFPYILEHSEEAGMVGSKAKKRAVFAAFVLPALGLYLFFAILPLAQGFWLSTTNWDGSAPWTPAQMPIAEFEARILGETPREADRAFLMRYYVRDEGQGTYRKQEVYGLARYRITRIIKRTGYVNPNFANVGLKNYRDIFSGKIDRRFFPERYREVRFQAGGSIADMATIPAAEFEAKVLAHAAGSPDEAPLRRLYSPSPGGYALDPALLERSELDLQTGLSILPGLAEDWEALYEGALKLGELAAPGEKGAAALEALAASLPAAKAGKVPAASLAEAKATAALAFELGRAKGLVSRNWYVERLKWGVLLFTGIFVLCNVALVNALGLLLALALDRGLRTRDLLRSIFFIPNVLSMIIVAFVWQIVFTQLLPALTGAGEWMMNPDLAPWITILVAVWQGVGYYTVIYLAGLQGIPTDIVESASLDGATGRIRFFKIVLPLLAPAITICLFLSIAGSLKTFDIIFALYPSNSTSMGVDNLPVNIFYDAFRDKHAGLATAKAILLLFTIAIVTGTQLALTKRREVEL
jgi:raffinose/stachyose/melibiose transport system permease protein